MAFTNDAEFKDDFRKAGADATAAFEQPGAPDNPTENAGSENMFAAKSPATVADPDDLDDDEEDEDLEDDEEVDEEDEDQDADLEDEDDEDEDVEDADDEDLDDDDEDEDEEDDDDEDEDEEGSDTAVMSRLSDAEKTARRR